MKGNNMEEKELMAAISPGINLVWNKKIKCSGTAFITDWYDNDGWIEMKPFIVECGGSMTNEEIEETILNLINDNGFGAKNIRGGIVDIEAEYESPNSGSLNKFKNYIKTIILTKPGYEIEKDEIESVFDAY